METVMSKEEYNTAIKQLTQLMNVPKIAGNKKMELEKLLDAIDLYNSMAFLKVQNQ